MKAWPAVGGKAAPPVLPPDAWRIAWSAFFADLGYQVVLAGFPLFLVIQLHAPVWVYGVAMALCYGPGALWAWIGGRWGDRWGHKRVAVWGSALIPLLALSGLAVSPWVAIGLLAVGWWARNVRKPPRQALLRAAVPEAARGRAFGWLHTLDQAGGMVAAVALVALVAAGVPLAWIFLAAAVPLAMSTGVLSRVRARPTQTAPTARGERDIAMADAKRRPGAYRGVLLAATLYGFSSYSVGFPILTVTQGTHSPALGIGAYIVLLATSAGTGILVGRWAKGRLAELAWGGYGAAALGALGLAVAVGHEAVWLWYLPMAVLGLAIGVIETLEPTLVARWVPTVSAGQGLGGLSGARSAGLFLANVVMGGLYHLSPASAYLYAGGLAVAALTTLVVVQRRGDRTPSEQGPL